MIRTMNESAVRAVLRAHMQGMCEGAVAKFLSIPRETVINIVYSYGVRKQLDKQGA